MELRQGKRFWGALAVAFSVMGLGAGLVLAHTTESETEIDFTTTQQVGSEPGGFKAKLDSPKGACIPGRAVRVVRTDDSKVMKSDRSGQSGNARILFPEGLAVDDYHLSVKRSKLRKPGHNHFCGKAESESTGYAFDPAD